MTLHLCGLSQNKQTNKQEIATQHNNCKNITQIQLSFILQNIWPILLKTVQVTKKQGEPEKLSELRGA